MGCDIHLHIEVKINQEWEHWSSPAVPRCYPLFNKLAGVRGYDTTEKPIAQPRGLPTDMTVPTLAAFDWEKADAHHTSWIGRDEIGVLEKWIRTELVKTWAGGDYICLEQHFLHSYCCGNGFAGIGYDDGTSYPKNITDVRFIFWFDN